MANFDVEFYSQALVRTVNFKMFIPNDRDPREVSDMKTLFLLHGYTGNGASWGLEWQGYEHNFAMVMPNGENSFYLDSSATGGKFCTFVGKELPEYLRRTFGLAKSREDTAIMGFSMGGFGALHTGLAHPENFGKIGAVSSALIVHEIANLKKGEDNGVANYDYYRHCFGELENVEQSENNPETLVKKLKAQGKKLPEIYMCCGTEDFLLENNREFHSFLQAEEIPHQYYESKGIHDHIFCNEYAGKIVNWMFG